MANLNELPPLVASAAYEERSVSPSVTEFDDGEFIYFPANTPNLPERLCPSYSEDAKILVRKLPLAPLESVDSVMGQSIEKALAHTKSIVSRIDGKINAVGVGSISVGGKALNIFAILIGNRTKNTLPTVRCLTIGTSGEAGINPVDFPLVISCKHKTKQFAFLESGQDLSVLIKHHFFQNGVPVPYDLKVGQRTYSDKLLNCARLYEQTQFQRNPGGAQVAQGLSGTETNQLNQLPLPTPAPQFVLPYPFSQQLPAFHQRPFPPQNQLPQQNQLHQSYYWAKVLIPIQNTNPPQLGYEPPITGPNQLTQPFQANPHHQNDRPPRNNFPPNPNSPQLGYGPQINDLNRYNQLHQVNLQHQMNLSPHTPNANRTPRANAPYQANHSPQFNH